MARTKTISNQAILDCARDVFLEFGSSASTKEIARRAGVSEGVLFQRFPTKSSLFLAAMIPNPVPVDRIVGAADEHADCPKEAIHAMARAVLSDFQHRIPIVHRLIASNLMRMEDLSAHFERITAIRSVHDLTNDFAPSS